MSYGTTFTTRDSVPGLVNESHPQLDRLRGLQQKYRLAFNANLDGNVPVGMANAPFVDLPRSRSRPVLCASFHSQCTRNREPSTAETTCEANGQRRPVASSRGT